MSRNLPLSGLDPLEQALTGEDLLLVSQNTPNGWKSFSVELAEFFNLAFAQGGVADYLDFLRDVKLRLNSGLLGNGTATNGLGINWTVLDDRYVIKTEFNQYKAQQAVKIDNLEEDVEDLKTRVGTLETSGGGNGGGGNGGGGSNPIPAGANPVLANLIWPIGCKITTTDKTFNPSVAYVNIFGYTTRWKLCKGIGVNANDISLDPGMIIANPNSKNINMAHNNANTQMRIITQDFQMADGVNVFNTQMNPFNTRAGQLTHAVDLLSNPGILNKPSISYLFFNEEPTNTKVKMYKAFNRFFNRQFQWLRIGDQEPTYTITANKAVAKYDTAGVDFTITTTNVPNGTQVKLFARFDWSDKVVANNLTEFKKVHEVVCVVIENNTANFNLKLATSDYTYVYTDKLLELIIIPEDTIYAPLEQVYFSLPISSGSSGSPTLQIILTDVSSQYGGRPGSIFIIKVVWSGISNMSGQKVNFVIWGAAVGDQWASGGPLYGISQSTGFPNNPSVMIHNTGSTPTYNGANSGAFKSISTVSSNGFGEYNHPSLFFIEDALTKEVASGSTASFKAYLGDNINSPTMESAVVVKAFNHPRS